ncbi:MAG TPA: hypothetical protein VHG69_03670 [Thermoleophilaceae bacterium]|nr:hypothetical protein [Thermoleophilaceae bacterium]
MTECLRAAQALHDHLARRHLRDGSLAGPDYGVRLNYRVGRFVKSYLRRIPWRDNLVYEQAQGYWILACSRLQERDGRNRLELVERCADGILRRQRADGSWAYPNPAWRGRVATAEGTWAAIGLLEAAQLLDDDRPLAGAQAWHSFLEERIGFRAVDGGLAVNYFAGRPGGAVPNNSAFVLRFLAGLARATGNDGHLARCRELIAFLASIQRPTGELPYSVPHSATEG